MSTDKTLATAKHGGCVQLGTSERERFEAWHREKFKTRWQTGAPTRDMHNGVYAENYGPAEQQERWELWQAISAAISAQPSPGGQGELLEHVARFLDYSVSHDPWPNIRRVYGESWWEPVRKMRDELRALAARRPETDEQYADEQALIDHLDSLMDDGGQGGEKWEPAQAAIAGIIAARQPVGEPKGWKLVPVKITDEMENAARNHGYYELNDCGDSVFVDGSRDEQWAAMLSAAPLAPPAQAVDLGAAIKAAFPLLTDYGLHHSQCCAYKLIDERHRLHNLIDSHSEVSRG